LGKTIQKINDNIKAISIIDPVSGEFCEEEGNLYIRDIPLKYEVVRVYIPEKYKREEPEEENILKQAEFFSGHEGAGNENKLRDDITSM
jgi:hypothetical protein